MSEDEDNEAYGSLCRNWGKRQTWTLKQFLCLLSGADPDDPQKERIQTKKRTQKDSSIRAINPREYKSRIQILRSYVGTSPLSPLNRTVPDEEQVFRKADLVAVAQSQGWDVPKALEAAAEAHPAKDWVDTGKGSLLLSERRRQALKEFVDEIYQRGQELDLPWAQVLKPLPFTKKDLFEAFKTRNRSLVRIAFSTFVDDLKAEGVKFSHGRKPNSARILAQVLSDK